MTTRIEARPAYFADVDFPAMSVVSEKRRKMVAEADAQTETVETEEAGTEMLDSVEASTQSEMGPREESKGEDDESAVEKEAVRALVSRMEGELIRTSDETAFEGYEPATLGEGSGSDVTYKYALTCGRVDPETSDLQCTSVSWNSTGNALCCAFGRKDVAGWCEDVGYLCSWSVFARDFAPDVPSFEIDHPTCLNVVACHPKNPALVAAGAQDGQVLVYNVGTAFGSEPLLAASDISDYFHREPITGLEWLRDARVESSDAIDAYQLISVSGDGRVLFWILKKAPDTLLNATPQRRGEGKGDDDDEYLAILDRYDDERNGLLPYPNRGVTLVRGLQAGRRALTSEQNAVVGGSALALFMDQRIGKGGPLALCVGSEGGRVIRCLVSNPKPGEASAKAKRHVKGRWDPAALELLGHATPGNQSRLAKHVEQFSTSGAAAITSRDVFKSKPKHQHLFPPPQATEFRAHLGPVASLACSPFHRHLFASAGLDGSLQLFSALNTAPLLRVDIDRYGRDHDFDDSAYGSLHACDWSKVRPLVIAVTGDDGAVKIFDLAACDAPAAAFTLADYDRPDPSDPVARLELPEPPAGSGPDVCARARRGLSVKFNARQRDFIACGDAAGRVHVWQLSWKLSNRRPDETQVLNRIVDRLAESI